MILLLQAIAVVLTIAGVVTFYLGNDPSMLSLGNTLMIVGAIAAVGGLVLIGLTVIAGRIDRLARGIDALKLSLAPAPSFVPPPAPALRPAEAEPRESDATLPGQVDLSALRASEPPRFEPETAEPAPRPVAPASRGMSSLGIEPARTEDLSAVPPVLAPVPAAVAPAVVELPRVEPVHVAPPQAPAPHVEAPEVRTPEIQAPKIEISRIEPALEDQAKAEPPAAEPAGAEPSAVVPPLSGGDATRPAPPAEAPVEPPRRMTFRERFGWKSAAAAAGTAAVGGAAVAAGAKAEERPADAPVGPIVDDKAKAEPDGSAGKSLEDMLGLALAETKPAPAAQPPVPPMPARAVEEDDLMARLRASILGPEPATAQPAPEPVAAEPEPEPAEEPVTDEPKPRALSIEDELEQALKAALGRDVAASPEPRDRFAQPRAAAAPEAEPEPAADRSPPPTGEGAMAALARDFPELGDILKRSPPPDPVEPVVVGRDGDEVHDSHTLESVAPEPDLAEPEPPSRQQDVEPAAAGPETVEPAAPEPRPAASTLVAPEPRPAASIPAAPVPAASARTPPLLREGVIAGIPFRLYGDGSIEADLPTGTTRFASLRDFRAHVGG